MIPSVEAIKKVLDKLVTSKYPKIIDYDVEIEVDENNSLITVVDVFFNKDGYWETYNEGNYDYTDQFDSDVEFAVKDSLKYLGLNNRVYTLVYVFGD